MLIAKRSGLPLDLQVLSQRITVVDDNVIPCIDPSLLGTNAQGVSMPTEKVVEHLRQTLGNHELLVA